MGHNIFSVEFYFSVVPRTSKVHLYRFRRSKSIHERINVNWISVSENIAFLQWKYVSVIQFLLKQKAFMSGGKNVMFPK